MNTTPTALLAATNMATAFEAHRERRDPPLRQ